MIIIISHAADPRAMVRGQVAAGARGEPFSLISPFRRMLALWRNTVTAASSC